MTLLNLKKNIEKKGIIFSLKIKFANFYLHKVEVNKGGLKKLLKNGVYIDIELLEGEEDWKAFLSDKTFVDLTDDDLLPKLTLCLNCKVISN